MPELSDSEETTVSNLTDWVNEPTVEDLRTDFKGAEPANQQQQAKVTEWLDNLHIRGSAKRKKVANKSNVQPKLIRKLAEWRYASLSEPFLSTENMFSVNPSTYEDESAAIQNGLLLNYQFNNQIDKVAFIDAYVRAAVNEGTAILRVGWDFEEVAEEVTRGTYNYQPAVTDEDRALAQSIVEKVANDPIGFELKAPRHEVITYNYMTEFRVPYVYERTGEETVTLTRTTSNKPTIEVCDYRNIYIDPSAKNNIDDAKFVISAFETSIADLRKDTGLYFNLDDITLENASIPSTPETNLQAENQVFQDRERKRIIAYEYWGYWDIDDTGYLKPIVATFVGNTMIRLEDSPIPDGSLPFVLVPFLPVTNSLFGEPDGELLKDNQDIVGAVTRGMIDTMASNAAGQKGIRKDALDYVNKERFRKGLNYEYNPTVDANNMVAIHTFPELPQSASVMLNYQNNEGESLTGVRSFAGGVSGEGLGEVAAGIRGALDASSKRELGILRRLVKGMTEVGKKILAMNGEYLSKQEVVRVTNEEYVLIDRDSLVGNFDLVVDITTIEEDNLKAQELAFMLQTLGNSVDFSVTKMIFSEIARLRKMPALAKRIEQYEQQPDPLAVQRANLENQLLQAQILEVQARAGNNGALAQLNSIKVNTEAAKARNLDSETDINNLDFVEQESGVTHERDIQRITAQSRGNTGLELVKDLLRDTNLNN